MEKQCLVCRNPFHVKPSHAKKKFYCSRECMAAGYRQRQQGQGNPNWKGGSVLKLCAYCAKEYKSNHFESKSSRFCSYACMGAAKQKNYCPICRRPAPRGRKYCADCWAQKQPRLIKRCAKCDEFIPGNLKYCQKCTPQQGNGKTNTKCEQCGRLFEHWKTAKRRFCSQACNNRTGKDNPHWKGGRLTIAQLIRGSQKNRDLVRLVLKRDKFTCNLCGQVGGELEVDHIKPFAIILGQFLALFPVLDNQLFARELFAIALKYKAFWDKNNLRTLCRKCNWQRVIDGKRLKHNAE